jgi:hypothetical protein
MAIMEKILSIPYVGKMERNNIIQMQENLEEKFESLLLKTRNAELIAAWGDLKIEIYNGYKNADKALSILESKIDNFNNK